jgi:glycine cleavage system aminomethyltransferase T
MLRTCWLSRARAFFCAALAIVAVSTVSPSYARPDARVLADAAGYEPICLGKELVGFVTSGGYGHCADTSIAMGYLNSSVSDHQSGISVTILGEPRPCRILRDPLIDPSGSRMRS